MIEEKKLSVRDFMVGFLLCALFWVPIQLGEGLFPPTPYGQVKILSEYREGTTLFVKASFFKGSGCVWQREGAWGLYLGEYRYLPLSDLDTYEGDRPHGGHSVTYRVETFGRPFEEVEIRVVHL